MIITGAQTKIKEAAAAYLLPSMSEGVLQSISVSMQPVARIPIKTLRSTKVRGVYESGRQPFSISYEIQTSPTIADIYFKRCLVALQKVSGKFYSGELPKHDTSPFIPLGISSAGWTQVGDNPASYVLNFEYFHAGTIDLTSVEPFEWSAFIDTNTETALDLTDGPLIPIESRSFQVTGDYNISRTIDGYVGINYSNVSLSQTIMLYDDAYVYEYPYDEYLDPFTISTDIGEDGSKSISRSSAINNGGHRIQTISRQGLLKTVTDSTSIDTISVFGSI